MSYGQGRESDSASFGTLSTLGTLATDDYVFNEHSTYHSACKIISLCSPMAKIYVSKSVSFEAIAAINKAPRGSILRLAPDIAENLAIAAVSYLPHNTMLFIDKDLPASIAKSIVANMPALTTLGITSSIDFSLTAELIEKLPFATFFFTPSNLAEAQVKALVAYLPNHAFIWIHNTLTPQIAAAAVTSLKPRMTVYLATTQLETVNAVIPILPDRGILWLSHSTNLKLAAQAIKLMPAGRKLFIHSDTPNIIKSIEHMPTGCEIAIHYPLATDLIIEALSRLPIGAAYRCNYAIPLSVIPNIISRMNEGSHLLIAPEMRVKENLAAIYANVSSLPKGCLLEFHPAFPLEYIHTVCAKLKPGSVIFIGHKISPNHAAACATAIPEHCSITFHPQAPLANVKAAVESLRENRSIKLNKDSLKELIATIKAYLPAGLPISILHEDAKKPHEFIAKQLKDNSLKGSSSEIQEPYSAQESTSLSTMYLSASHGGSGGAASQSSSIAYSTIKPFKYPHYFTPGDYILVKPTMTEADIKKAFDDAGPIIRLEFAAGVSVELAVYTVKNLPQSCALIISENNSLELAKAAASNLPKGRCLHCLNTAPKPILQAAVSNLTPGCKLLLHTDIRQDVAKAMAESLPPGCILPLSDSIIGSQPKEYIKDIVSSLKAGCIVYITHSLYEEHIFNWVKKNLANGCLLIDGRNDFYDIEDDNEKEKTEQASEEPIFTRSSLSIFESLRTATYAENYYSEKLRTEIKYPRFYFGSKTTTELAIKLSKRVHNGGMLILNRFMQEKVAVEAASNLTSASFLAFSPDFSKDPVLIKKICQNVKKVYILENTPEDLAVLIGSCLAPGCSLSFNPHLSASIMGRAAANLALNCSILLDNNLYCDQAQACAYNLSKANSVRFAPGTSKDIIHIAAFALESGRNLVLNPSISNEIAARAVEFLKENCILPLSRSILNDNPEQQIKAIIPHLGVGAILQIKRDFPSHLAEIAIACLSTSCALQDDRPKPADALAIASSSPVKITGHKRTIAEISPSK